MSATGQALVGASATGSRTLVLDLCLWANLHLLFWLSLIPFATEWMGEHHEASAPTGLYGVVLLCAGAAYTILQRALIREQGAGSRLAAAVGLDVKGLASVAVYAIAIIVAFYRPAISEVLYASVALLWLVPDRRIERTIHES